MQHNGSYRVLKLPLIAVRHPHSGRRPKSRMAVSGFGTLNSREDHHSYAKPDEEHAGAARQETEVVVSCNALMHNVCGGRVGRMNHYDR